MPIIKPSASIRNNYNEISNLAKEKKCPVFLTRNGEGDLVVKDMETFERRERQLDLREKLLEIEEKRKADNPHSGFEKLDFIPDKYKVAHIWKHYWDIFVSRQYCLLIKQTLINQGFADFFVLKFLVQAWCSLILCLFQRFFHQ